jgi:hypothetical protein
MPDPNSPIACTLAPGQREERREEFRRLFAGHLRTVEREPRRLRLALHATHGVEATARDLLARERLCCAFLTFTVTTGDDVLLVDAEVPEGADAALDGFHELALGTVA